MLTHGDLPLRCKHNGVGIQTKSTKLLNQNISCYLGYCVLQRSWLLTGDLYEEDKRFPSSTSQESEANEVWSV